MSGVVLRPYQETAITGVRQAYAAGKKSPLLVMGCGAGKTVCFSYIAENAVAKGKRVLVVAHRRELIKQASRKLSDAGVQHGIIAPGFTPTRHMCQVASIQTIGRRIDEIDQFDIVVIDEGHHSVAGQYVRLIASQTKARFLGVTATAERLDGRGLGIHAGGCFDEIILGPQPDELIAAGYLKPIKVFGPANSPDLSGVKVRLGDYERGALADVMSGPAIVGCAVEHYARHTPGWPAVVFCVNVEHARTVAAMFRAAGWRAKSADGSMKSAERDDAFAGLENGSIQVLTVCDICGEGLDIPGISVVIILRGTKSLTNFLQWIGRGNRPVYAHGYDLSTPSGRKAAIAASAYPHLIVLDHAGCTLTHGMPDMEREWTLDGRLKKQAGAPTEQCKVCFAIYPPAPVCPECGNRKTTEGKPTREIETVAGQLVELTDPARPAWANGINIMTARGVDWLELLGLADTESKLLAIAKARKYHRGWIQRQMQVRRDAELRKLAA